MARTYYHAGPAGRECGRLVVSRRGDGLPLLVFITTQQAPALSREQVKDLVVQLHMWLDETKSTTEPPVMMEGEL